MTSFLLALLLASAPTAVKVCPDTVGQSHKSMLKFYAPLLAPQTPSNRELRRLGLVKLAEDSEREEREYRSKWLGEKIRLGYDYLDAKCYPEARLIFNEVWGWTDPAYSVYAQQAREALNLMNSKGQ